jgi:hypothetical protein
VLQQRMRIVQPQGLQVDQGGRSRGSHSGVRVPGVNIE